MDQHFDTFSKSHEHRAISPIRCIAVSICAAFLTGCLSNSVTENDEGLTTDDESAVKQDTFIEFKSQLGNTILHPSQWTVEDNGDLFTILSPDEQAVIRVLTFTVEGTGSMADFQETMVAGVSGDWKVSEWTDIEIDGVTGQRAQMTPTDESVESSFRIYALRSGDCYHSIVVHASPLVMALNGEFYEKIVKSFKGISGLD